MLNFRFFDIPSRLQPFIERATMIDFSNAVGATWQFMPTGCYGVTLLAGPQEHDYELRKPHADGAFSGIASQMVGTWCEQPCYALGISLTPLGVMHLPIHAHDFDDFFVVRNEVMFGEGGLRKVRRLVRDARTPEDKMQVFLRWMEGLLMDQFVTHGRAGAIAEVAHLMRTPRPPTVVEAAARVGVHRRQLERDFRRLLGTSPKRYAMIARVQQVAQLSWQGMGLAGIAAELGFTDQAHMSHAVKEVTGMSPKALLRAAEGSELARATRPFSGGRVTFL